MRELRNHERVRLEAAASGMTTDQEPAHTLDQTLLAQLRKIADPDLKGAALEEERRRAQTMADLADRAIAIRQLALAESQERSHERKAEPGTATATAGETGIAAKEQQPAAEAANPGKTPGGATKRQRRKAARQADDRSPRKGDPRRDAQSTGPKTGGPTAGRRSGTTTSPGKERRTAERASTVRAVAGRPDSGRTASVEKGRSVRKNTNEPAGRGTRSDVRDGKRKARWRYYPGPEPPASKPLRPPEAARAGSQNAPKPAQRKIRPEPRLTYESVVDFRANGPTRGMMAPVVVAGKVVRPKPPPAPVVREREPFYSGTDGERLWNAPRDHRKDWSDRQWASFEEHKLQRREARSRLTQDTAGQIVSNARPAS